MSRDLPRPARRLLAALLALAALAVGASARAQNEPSPETQEAVSPGEPLRGGWYETATVRARPVELATVAVDVLDREAIEATNAATVAELLRFVPGVDVVAAGPRAGVAWAQIRGGDPNFTVVLVDGVPLNDSTDRIGGVVDLHAISVDHVERIEIVRGPLSSFFGSTGLAGAINIITRRGRGDGSGAELRAAAGDAEARHLSGSLSHGSERARWFVGASGEREEGRIDDDRFEQVSVVANGDVALGASSRLGLSARITSGESDDWPDASGGPLLGTGELRRSEHEDLSLAAEWEVGPVERRHRLRLEAHRRALERDSPAVPPQVPASVETTRFTDWRLGWTWPALAVPARRVHVGVEVRGERGENESVLFLPPELGGEVDGSYELDRTAGGAFVEAVAGRGRLTLEGGARVDAPEGFGAELSPRAGVTWRASERTRLRVAAGRAFKLPSFFVLGSPPALGGNPDLEPEISWGGDAGIEHRFEAARLRVAVDVFAYRFENLIDFDFETFTHVNRSDVRAQGAEARFDWTPREALAVHASVTRQDVEIQGTDEPLRHRPDWVGGLRVVWRPLDRLTWQVDGQAVSERFDQQIPVPDRRIVAGSTVWGTALTWRSSSLWALEARVDNVTGKGYETLIGFPGPDRSVRIGVVRRFGNARSALGKNGPGDR